MRKVRYFLPILLITLFTNCASLSVRDTANRDLYDNITIEIAPITSVLPGNEALEFLRTKLDKYRICDYRRIKFVIRPGVNVIQNIPWTSSRLRTFERTRRTLHDKNPNDRHLIMFIAYVSGPYVDGKFNNLAGLQYNASIAIFKDSPFWRNEGSVLLHEFGHLLEIADSSHRKDETPVNPDRPNHCNNKRCVMFWRIQSRNMDFDEQCRKELRNLVDTRR